MIRRILVMSIALSFVSFSAFADDMGGEDIVVPPPAQVVEVVEEPVTAAPPPWVTMESTSIAAGIGLSWGDGVLIFEGERHAFSVKGMSLLDLGFAKLMSEGAVENLDSVADFAGNYVALEVGAAVGVGASRTAMRNENGVVIHLSSDVAGVALALGPEGLHITLD